MTPLVEGDHAQNCLAIAQNEYSIDGKLLPQGVALAAAHDEILRLERMSLMTGDDGTSVYAIDVVSAQNEVIDRLRQDATHRKQLIGALRSRVHELEVVIESVATWAHATGAMSGSHGSADARLLAKVEAALAARTLANGPHDHDHLKPGTTSCWPSPDE